MHSPFYNIQVTIQVPDSSPPPAARVFFCCGLGSLRLPSPQQKISCEPPKVVRSPEQLQLEKNMENVYTLATNTTNQLVAQAPGGDHGGFEALVQRYQRPLLHCISSYLGDRDQAYDVLQQLLLNCMCPCQR